MASASRTCVSACCWDSKAWLGTWCSMGLVSWVSWTCRRFVLQGGALSLRHLTRCRLTHNTNETRIKDGVGQTERDERQQHLSGNSWKQKLSFVFWAFIESANFQTGSRETFRHVTVRGQTGRKSPSEDSRSRLFETPSCRYIHTTHNLSLANWAATTVPGEQRVADCLVYFSMYPGGSNQQPSHWWRNPLPTSVGRK